jgi:predicted GIY-YIG superfamily endonuclease
MNYFIYVIGPDNPPLKIGITNNCERRLRSLQTGHCEKLKIYHQEPVDRNLAKTFESIVHHNLKLKRTHGEWFNITVEQAINEIKFVLIRYSDEIGLKDRFKSKLLLL